MTLIPPDAAEAQPGQLLMIIESVEVCVGSAPAEAAVMLLTVKLPLPEATEAVVRPKHKASGVGARATTSRTVELSLLSR